jgi:hypothetical protein
MGYLFEINGCLNVVSGYVRSAPRCVSRACCYLDVAPAEIAEIPKGAGEESLEPDLFEVSNFNKRE